MLIFLLTSLLTLSPFLSNSLLIPSDINEAIDSNLLLIEQPHSLGIEVTAKSAIVVDMASQKVIFAKNIHQPLPIASLTKLMSAMIVVNGSPDWTSLVEYQKDDNVDSPVGNGIAEPSLIKFLPGEKINLFDLFNAALIKSANNAVKSLIRGTSLCCGHTFVEQMNREATKIGMQQTIFVEPTGLNPGNVATAEDLVKLILAIKDRPKIVQALTQQTYSFSSNLKSYSIKSTNKLLSSFIKVIVGKTGYLEEAQYCFAGITGYQNQRFVVVLLGSQSDNDRSQEVKGLTVWAAQKSR